VTSISIGRWLASAWRSAAVKVSPEVGLQGIDAIAFCDRAEIESPVNLDPAVVLL
jgi:hypothetical protein